MERRLILGVRDYVPHAKSTVDIPTFDNNAGSPLTLSKSSKPESVSP